MKKLRQIVSLTLSALITFSCFTGLFAAGVSAAEESSNGSTSVDPAGNSDFFSSISKEVAVGASDGLNITAQSNLFSDSFMAISKTELSGKSDLVTVSYYINTSKRLLDFELELSFDPQKLEFTEDFNYDEDYNQKIMPQLMGDMVINDSTAGKIKCYFSSTQARTKLTNDGELVPFMTVTFKVIGSGDTTVSLDIKNFRICDVKNGVCDNYTIDWVVRDGNVQTTQTPVLYATAAYAGTYALYYGIPFIASVDEDIYIKNHLDFIGTENSNNAYHNQLRYFDLAEIALRDYGDLDETYNLWKTVRGDIFENPYYTVLADMIISDSTAQGQLESFDIHLDSEWRSVANDIIGLINSKVDLTSSQESKIKNMFKKGDFTDETTFKLCQDVLGNKVSKDELNSIFNAYDKTNTFLEVFDQGADIVESVYDTMNYSSILKAYENTSDEFKVVLMQMAYTCENPCLYTAIDKYLKSDYDTEMRNKIVEEVTKNGLSIGKTLFKSSIENKVKAFLFNNMDLSKIGTSVATKVLAFTEGGKIGYAIGTGIDNLLFNTDDVSNSFVVALATAKTTGYLKYVLETNEANLRNNPTIRNTVLFCETYNMYKNIQLNTADTMIKYFSKNQTSLINRIFQSNNVLYEYQIYNWQILKLNWQNASCHKGYILNSKLKNVTVACPVDVTVYTSTGEIALQITNNIIQKNNSEVVATICNNIKYISLPDDSYSVKITATGSGTMTYSITNYDAFDHSSKTTNFDGISISKGNEYTGNIVSGSDYTQNDITLCCNNEEVESVVSEFTNEDLIKVDSISLSSVSISLKIEETKTITATVEPGNASNKTVTWYSDNPQIAQVDEYGNVTGVSVGKTKIYCVSLEGDVVTECDISVESNYSIADTDLNGVISINDVTAIQKHLVGLISFSDEQLALADTNGDGEVNISDATHLQFYLAEFDRIVLGKAIS